MVPNYFLSCEMQCVKNVNYIKTENIEIVQHQHFVGGLCFFSWQALSRGSLRIVTNYGRYLRELGRGIPFTAEQPLSKSPF